MDGIHAWPSIRRRHEAAPSLQEREAYLLHLQLQGTNRRQLRVISSMLLNVVRLLDLTEPRLVSREEVTRAGDRWTSDETAHEPRKAGPHARRTLEGTAKQFLRFSGLLIESARPGNHFDDVLDAYLHNLATERRLASATVVTSESHMRRFFVWLAPKRESIAQATPLDIDDFLRLKQTTCSLRSVAGEARILQDFFSYAEQQSLCSGAVKRSIFAPSISRPSYVGKRVAWEDVRLLAEGITGQRPCELRAKAIVLLCSIYALRSGEVAGLKLDNFNWELGTFSLLRAKRGRAQEYPIQFEVGQAILAYLRGGRPRSSCRNLFLSIAIPYRPISPCIVFHVVSSRLSKLGVDASSKGAHALRHACATQLLKTGSSLKEIADFLGHRNLRTVSNYVRHDEAALRCVADFRMLGEK